MFRKLLIAAATSLALAGTSAQAADPITITTGKSGGGYHTIGSNLAKVLGEQGLTAEVQTSVGSMENLQRLDLATQPAAVGLTQADALMVYLRTNPGFKDKLNILGRIGKECVFIIAGADSDIDDDGDLQGDDGYKIAVQSMNSGVAITWQFMGMLEEKFKRTKPLYMDSTEALLEIRNKTGKVHAAMLVQRPSARSDEMQIVLERPDDFKFVAVEDWDLDDKLPDGTPVYDHDKVTVERVNWGFDTKVETVCTQGLVIANNAKLDDQQRGQLARAFLMAADRIIGSDE